MTTKRWAILIFSAALVFVLAACGETRRAPGNAPVPSTAPGSLPPPARDHTSPLEEQRVKWPEQVAQLEEIIQSNFLRESGGSAVVFDGVLHIELYNEADLEEAKRRWPAAVVEVLPPPVYE